MTIQFAPAKRENVSLLIGLPGGTGSGKTFSGMRLAKGLAGGKRFAVIDSEAGRAKHYADMFEFDHADLRPPFRPERYLEAIKAAEAAGYGVILVDSMSHEWDGAGGLLDWHEQEMGGKEAKKLTAWIKPKMAHRKFVGELLQLRAHLVLCFRAQQKVDMVKIDGKWEIVPKRSLTGLDGWIPICEKNLPFELTMSLLMTADAPGVPHPIKLQEQHRMLVPLDRPLTEETGRALAEWAAGADATPSETDTELQDLIGRLVELADVLGKREATMSAIARNRQRHRHDLSAHTAWLRSQIAAAEAKIAADGDSADADLFTDLPPEPESEREEVEA